MTTRRALTRALAGVVIALAITNACSADQQALVVNHIQQEQAALANHGASSALSDAQLARLARCESGGNPRARSSNGLYHGLYQFNQRTWNGVAASVLPAYVGVSPSAAPAHVQNAMARALYASRGRQPWPVCGRRI